MPKVAIYLLCLTIGLQSAFAQSNKNSGVNWESPHKLADFRLTAMDKPILVDVYTDWCHYCKLMDATTWRHKELSGYVNENFYPVKFNAEAKDSLVWNGRMYTYAPRYNLHMLAAELLKGNIVYPSTVIIAPNGDVQVFRGALKAAELQLALTYYGSGSYQNQPFEDYMRKFSRTWQ